jgi:micrococcal nuclease
LIRQLLVAVLGLAALAFACSSPAAALTIRGTVSDLVDGDTIKVVSRGFETPVRLLGIDTPETRNPNTPVQCFGPAASKRTRRLLPVGQKVRLITDPTQDTRDRYARLLAYVYKPGRSGPTGSVNYSLVASGHAKVYVYQGVRFRYAVPFFKAQHRARAAKRGLWGPPCRGNTKKPDPSQPAPTQPPTSPAPDPTPPAAPGCDPNYSGACIPPYPPDLDCGEIPDRNFRSVGSDPHNFDVDHDGIACEE